MHSELTANVISTNALIQGYQKDGIIYIIAKYQNHEFKFARSKYKIWFIACKKID